MRAPPIDCGCEDTAIRPHRDDCSRRSPYSLAFTITNRKTPPYDILVMACNACRFAVAPASFRRPGDRSGMPRYNRARGAMVKHLHTVHGIAGKRVPK